MPRSSRQPLNLASLREQVYRYLREAMEQGNLVPGVFLDLNRLAERLGISRTPLRDALLQLQSEGFVEILPRRGVRVVPLTLEEIRHLYTIIGALEGAAVLQAGPRLTRNDLGRMRRLNEQMQEAVADDDFDRYYRHNLAFHGTFLEKAGNERLRRLVETGKHRLYDFPRRQAYLRDWESRSTDEHETFLDLVEAGDLRGAADYLRDVHWSFEVQEPFIRRYYLRAVTRLQQAGKSAPAHHRGTAGPAQGAPAGRSRGPR
jgi:DNA-binding GntR family transcriptional regulator